MNFWVSIILFDQPNNLLNKKVTYLTPLTYTAICRRVNKLIELTLFIESRFDRIRK